MSEATVEAVVESEAIEPEPFNDDDTPAPPLPPPALSLRDRIAAVDDIEKRVIHVDKWGIDVEVRSMDANTRALMIANASTVVRADDADPTASSIAAQAVTLYERIYVDLVIACTYDPETGERAFDEADKEMLMTKAADAVEQIAQAAMDISGLGAKAVDEAAKDFSSATPSDGSTSSSPAS